MDPLPFLEAVRRDGDSSAAQEELYGIIRQNLLEPLRSKIEGRLKARLDAEDVLHDAFLRAMGGLPAVDFPNGRAFLASLPAGLPRTSALEQVRRWWLRA